MCSVICGVLRVTGSKVRVRVGEAHRRKQCEKQNWRFIAAEVACDPEVPPPCLSPWGAAHSHVLSGDLRKPKIAAQLRGERGAQWTRRVSLAPASFSQQSALCDPKSFQETPTTRGSSSLSFLYPMLAYG